MAEDAPDARVLRAHGLSVTLPEGWEGRITRPPSDGVPEATRNPVLHAASLPLPESRGDFGGGVVERLDPGGVFIAMLEYDREATATALFAAEGVPKGVSGSAFAPNTLQRTVAGQSGSQWFFQAAGRAFCLYVVLGSHIDRWRLATTASHVVQTITVD